MVLKYAEGIPNEGKGAAHLPRDLRRSLFAASPLLTVLEVCFLGPISSGLCNGNGANRLNQKLSLSTFIDKYIYLERSYQGWNTGSAPVCLGSNLVFLCLKFPTYKWGY